MIKQILFFTKKNTVDLKSNCINMPSKKNIHVMSKEI